MVQGGQLEGFRIMFVAAGVESFCLVPVLHKSLGVGDIVLLVEPHFKQHNYTMGIVKEIKKNFQARLQQLKFLRE